MSHIPNPFLCGELQPKQPHTPAGPAFLMMTRPPSGANRYGGPGRSQSLTPQRPPFDPSTPPPTGNFIPFTAANQDRRGGRHSVGGGRGSPRPFTPYQASPYHPSPPRGAGDWSAGYSGGGQGQGFTPRGGQGFTPRGGQGFTPRGGQGFTPRGGQGFSPSRGGQGQGFTPSRGGNRDSFGQNRFSFNGSGRGGRGQGPISDIPVEKFVSPSMVTDPWAEFDVPDTTVPAPATLTRTSTLPLLDNSEIGIDSDTSVVVENSFEGGGDGGGTATSASLRRTSTLPSLDNSEIVIDSDTSGAVPEDS